MMKTLNFHVIELIIFIVMWMLQRFFNLNEYIEKKTYAVSCQHNYGKQATD